MSAVWRRFRPTKRGWEDVAVPLAPFAGRDVVLSLALDCGPGGFNTSCDEVVWVAPRLVAEEK